MSAYPSNDELVALLEGEDGARVAALRRRPFAYATSAALEELDVRRDDGAEVSLILKHLTRERLLGDAPMAKPVFLSDPRRESETYRAILAAAGIGPRFVAAPPSGEWVLIERTRAVDMREIGEPDVWTGVASWLARFHSRFAGRADELRALNPHLLEHSVDWFMLWRERAGAALRRSGDPRAAEVNHLLRGYDEVAAALAAQPRTLVHGEFFPSNVLVAADERPLGVYPIDWELAAVGPALIDLAAFVSGWGEYERGRLVAAYIDAAGESADIAGDLLRCRLHLALQWLGWSPSSWQPPAAQAHDWIGEALAVAEQLRLG
jgi:hypothetical protein